MRPKNTEIFSLSTTMLPSCDIILTTALLVNTFSILPAMAIRSHGVTLVEDM